MIIRLRTILIGALALAGLGAIALPLSQPTEAGSHRTLNLELQIVRTGQDSVGGFFTIQHISGNVLRNASPIAQFLAVYEFQNAELSGPYTLTIFDSAGSPPINLTLSGAINRSTFESSGTVSAISPGVPSQFLGAEFTGSGTTLTINY